MKSCTRWRMWLYGFCMATASLMSAVTIQSHDLKAFLDGFMPMQLLENNIAGAVVVVVKDGQVLLCSGYGYRDEKNKIPMDGNTTLLRVASISKLFTATAVMQLVEQGLLDLDTDVNQYLDFTIHHTFPNPITLRTLLTHTSGFEDVGRNLAVPTGDRLVSLQEYLVENQPVRIFPPGVVPTYSNYGTTLAGYIVQRVANEPFEEYVERHILRPLHMENSTFLQPVPNHMQPHLSKGYVLASDRNKPFEFIQAIPAGAMTSSGADIAKFMLANLQKKSSPILKDSTLKMMHERVFGSSPELGGMDLGFFERTRHGQRVLEHAGDTRCFHSQLHLIPQENLGFFVIFNSAGYQRINLASMLWRAFIDRYFPYQIVVKELAGIDPGIEGNYMTTKRFETSFLRLLNVLSTARVDRAGNEIIVDAICGFNCAPKNWKRIAPNLYQTQSGEGRLLFTSMDDGTRVMFTDIGAFTKCHWYESRNFAVCLLIGSTLYPLISLLSAMVRGSLHWYDGTTCGLTSFERKCRRWTWFGNASQLMAIVLWGIFIYYSLGEIGRLNSQFDGLIYFLQLLYIIGVVFFMTAIINAYHLWSEPHQSGARIHALLQVLAGLSFVWLGFIGRLVSFPIHY